MPSAYTEKLFDGDVTFADFVRDAARNYWYDDDAEGTTKRLEAGLVHARKGLAEAQADLQQAAAWSPDEVEAACTAWFAECAADRSADAARDRLRRERITAMATALGAWQVPELLQPLRKFLIEHLVSAVRDLHELPVVPEILSAQVFHMRVLKNAHRDVAFWQKKIDEATVALQRIREREAVLAEALAALREDVP